MRAVSWGRSSSARRSICSAAPLRDGCAAGSRASPDLIVRAAVGRHAMATAITPEHPASPDATALIAELDAHLTPLYASESRHGFSVQKLIADAVAFFV